MADRLCSEFSILDGSLRDSASGYVAPYVPAGRQPPVCFETTGNTEDGEDEVPQGGELKHSIV